MAGLIIAGNVFTDDIGFNDLVKLHLDTKLKLAGQASIKFAPEKSAFSLLNLDYTLVAPYMYSHSQYDLETNKLLAGTEINYQNYSSNGESIGTAVQPNSDRIAVKTIMNPLENLRITISSLLIRHANVNESLPDEYAEKYLAAPAGSVLTDGSIFDYPDAGDGYFTYANHHFMFMSQPTKMYVYQIGVDAAYDYFFGKNKNYGKISLSLGWTFEYIKNNGVQNNMFTCGTLAEGYTEEQAAAAIAAAKSAWAAKLYDTINNYFSIKVRYAY